MCQARATCNAPTLWRSRTDVWRASRTEFDFIWRNRTDVWRESHRSPWRANAPNYRTDAWRNRTDVWRASHRCLADVWRAERTDFWRANVAPNPWRAERTDFWRANAPIYLARKRAD
jgi:hypothetical protein